MSTDRVVAPACTGSTDCVAESVPPARFVPPTSFIPIKPLPPGPQIIPAPPPPSLSSQFVGFPAAKYFSYIFFAVAITVIFLFGALVLYHVMNRRRARQRRQMRAANIAGFDLELGAPRRPIPMKQGFLVTQPDGNMEVAYDPSAPDLRPTDVEGSQRNSGSCTATQPPGADQRCSSLPESGSAADGREPDQAHSSAPDLAQSAPADPPDQENGQRGGGSNQARLDLR